MLCSNMFAYCLNNPVNGYDPCGTCFHRWDFWNDCEECGGKTWDEKLNDFATGIYNYATDVYDAHMMQIESQQQVDQNSFRFTMDSTVAVCDAISEGNDNMNTAEYQTNQATHAIIADRISTSQKTSNTLSLISSTGYLIKEIYGLYSAAAAGTSIGGPLGGVVLAGLAVFAVIFAIQAE